MNKDAIAKLPKWAQSHIQQQQRQIESQAALLSKSGEVVSTDLPGISWPDYSGQGMPVNRQVPGDKIRLVIDRKRWVEVRIKGTRFEIMCAYHDDVAVIPRSSNSLEIGFAKIP